MSSSRPPVRPTTMWSMAMSTPRWLNDGNLDGTEFEISYSATTGQVDKTICVAYQLGASGSTRVVAHITAIISNVADLAKTLGVSRTFDEREKTSFAC